MSAGGGRARSQPRAWIAGERDPQHGSPRAGGDRAASTAPPGTELLQGQAFLREGVGWGCSPPSPWEPLAPLLSTVPAPGPWAELAERRRAPLEKAAISQPAYKQDNSPCPRSPQESWEEESSVQPQRSAEDKQPRSATRSPRLLRDARWGLPRCRAGSARG